MVKWCVIGAGGIADRRAIPALLKDKNNELVAIMERVPELAEELGKKYGVKSFTDEREMLSSVECNAVYIGTPLFRHKSQMEICLEFDKHVFVEKPFTMTAEEGEEILRKFREKGKMLTVGYMMKYHNLHVKAKELIKSGEIGKPTLIRAQFSCWYPETKGAWRQVRALGGGGCFMDLGVHCIELIEYLLDEEIVEVKSFLSTSTFSYDVEDTANVLFRTASGVTGSIATNFNIPDAASTSKLEVYGSGGYVIANGTLSQEESGELLHLYAPQGAYEAAQIRVSSEPVRYLPEGQDVYLRQIRDFCRVVESGEPEYFYAERALQVQSVVDRVYSQNK